MRQTQFLAECEKRLIDMKIALENEKVYKALLNRDDEELLRLLDEEF